MFMLIFPSVPDEILILGLSVFICSLVILSCIMPLIFNVFVIPEIEKRIGKELMFSRPSYNFYPFSRCLTRHYEVAIYIFIKLLGIKKEPSCSFALSKTNGVNYNIKNATKSEIIISIIDVMAITSFVIGLAIMAIKLQFDNSHDAQNKYSSNNAVYMPSIPALHNTNIKGLGGDNNNVLSSPDFQEYSHSPVVQQPAKSGANTVEISNKQQSDVASL